MKGSGAGFLLVRTAGRRIGLALSQVVEVMQVQRVHPVPAVEPSVRGVVSVHGRVVPLVHLGALLDVGPYPLDASGLAVLVDVDGRRLCLEVDEVEVVVRQPALPIPPGTSFPWATGVARHGEGLVPLLHLEALSSRLTEATA